MEIKKNGAKKENGKNLGARIAILAVSVVIAVVCFVLAAIL